MSSQPFTTCVGTSTSFHVLPRVPRRGAWGAQIQSGCAKQPICSGILFVHPTRKGRRAQSPYFVPLS